MNIELHTFPHGQQLSDGELVQVQVKQSGRLIFKDSYFHELQDGDVYIIPAQAELPPATDTEILDHMLDNKLAWANHGSFLIIWDKETSEDKATRGWNPELTDIRSVFREAMTEIINNQQL